MNDLSKRLADLSPEKRELVLKKLEQQKGIPTKYQEDRNLVGIPYQIPGRSEFADSICS